MHHLNLEALARLVDEPALPEEAAHLRDCLVCRRELDGMREQTAALGELPGCEPAPAAWDALESRLLQEGLIAVPAAVVRPAATRRTALRAAAAIALFVTGSGAGALAWERMRAPAPAPVAVLPAADVPARTIPEPTAGAMPAEYRESVVADAGAAPSGARLAAGTRTPAPAPRSAAVRRAEQALEEAEVAYLAALRQYAELADPASGADPATRLEALDRLVEMSARALDRAPGDPQLNGYHLAALNERDALRRQMQQAAATTWF